MARSMPDLFERIILDALDGDRTEHFNERDDGYAPPSSGLQYLLPHEKWHFSEREAIRLARGPVLDLGCGGGRPDVYFNTIGQEYIGIDTSPGALDACLTRGFRKVILMSLTHLRFQPNCFKTVLMFGNNFGIPGNYDGIIDLLRDLHDLISEDAIILAQSRDPKATDEPAHHQYHEINLERGRPPGLVKFHIRYKGEVSDWIDLLLCSPEEMSKLADQTVWSLKRVFGERNLYVGLLQKK